MTQYSSLLLVLLILCVASSNSISSTKVVEVDVICKETLNPSYCSNLLNSKPGGSKGVNLVDLGLYTTEVLDNNLTNTHRLVADLENAANDTVLQYYYYCVTGLISVDINLGDARLSLEAGNYSGMAKATTKMMPYILNCIDSLHKNKTSPLLAKYVEVLQLGAQVLRIIAKYLNVRK